MIPIESSPARIVPLVCPLKTVCAWCRLTICEGPGPVSHGLCSACAEQLENGGAR